MCGIFGLVTKNTKFLGDIRHFANRLMYHSMVRGRDATGFAAVAKGPGQRVEFITDKHPVDAEDFYTKSLEWRRLLYRKNISIIGHTRAATDGPPERNVNNHPFHGRRYSLVHNGGVWSHDSLAKCLDINLETECDSELLLHLLEAKESLDDSIVHLFNEVDYMAAMAVAAIDRQTGDIHLFRNNSNPCWVVEIPDWSCIAFASTQQIITEALRDAVGSAIVSLKANWLFGNEMIPVESRITITPSGKVTSIDLSKSIAPKTYSSDAKSKLDTAVFAGGQSKFEKSKTSTVKTWDDDYELCTECYEPLAPNEIHRMICDGCLLKIQNADDDVSDVEVISIDHLYEVLPRQLARQALWSVTDYLSGIREIVDDYELSEAAQQQYLYYSTMTVKDKRNVWSAMTVENILNMTEGEYLAYFNHIEDAMSSVR